MIKTLSPSYYPTTSKTNINAAKTAEIMSKYRPIAPKPDTTNESSSSSSSPIKQSPYLKNLLPQLQARPTRTRKRNNRVERSPSKRSKTPFGIGRGYYPSNYARLSVPSGIVDLNIVVNIPEEKDLLQQLEEQEHQSIGGTVITPQPVRPVGSTIVFGCVTVAEEKGKTAVIQRGKRLEEVEEEVESEELPAIISDSNNRVKMANSAYKKMIGQPLCPWLELGGDSCCKRICGEVMLQLCDDSSSSSPSPSPSPSSSSGVCVSLSNGNIDQFSCWARIEWEGQDGGKTCVNAFADVVRSSICESKDCVFTWRFHTTTTTTTTSRDRSIE